MATKKPATKKASPVPKSALVNYNLNQKLQEHFGFEGFKYPQEEIITSLLSGKDTFVIMPTGGGKSLCYQLPALVQHGTAIVVSPLIALMKNQVDAIRGISKKDGIAHVLNSSLSKTISCLLMAPRVLVCQRLARIRRIPASVL